MGVLNVTPDSFSDGGRWLDAGAAVEHGLEMVREGADAPLEFELSRDIIAMRAVRWSIQDDVALLRLIRFSEQAYVGVQQAIKDIYDDTRSITEPAGALGSTSSFGAAASLKPASVSSSNASPSATPKPPPPADCTSCTGATRPSTGP